MRKPRFIVERKLDRRPAGVARTIKTVWLKVAAVSKLATAERCLINALQDGGECRLREAR